MNPTNKPDFVYIARRICGCVCGLVGDEADKATAEFVSDCIKVGLHIERVSWRDYEEKIRFESTFFSCPHEVNEQELQPKLFSGDEK